MLSVFPSLLSWSELAPFLLRLTLGATFLYMAYRALRAGTNWPNATIGKLIAVVEAAAGLLLVLGLYAQIGALVVVVDLVVRLIGRIQAKAFLTDGVNYYLLLLVMALAVLVSGAGLFAFDYRI